MLTLHGQPGHRAQRLIALPAAVALVANWEDSWDDPGRPFEEWLRDCVMRAVRGYCQQGKPNSLRREESVQVYRKAVKVVLDNERKASPAPVLAHGVCVLPVPPVSCTARCSCFSSRGLRWPSQSLLPVYQLRRRTDWASAVCAGVCGEAAAEGCQGTGPPEAGAAHT